MKFLIILFAEILIVNYLSAQDSLNPKTSPLNSTVSYIGEDVNNISGGIKTGSNYLGMFNFKISFETEKAKLWKGGQLFINGANTHGGTPTAELIGDFQGISNIEAGDLTYFHELWFKQTIKNISLTIGVQDLNTDFVSSEYAGLFTNGTFGTHSTISDNVPAPVFPLTAFGANLQYKISDKITGKIIAYDGFPDDFEDNKYNIKWKYNRKDGLLTISEFTFSDTFFNDLSGTYKVGGYSHNHFAKEKDSLEITNNYGFYIVADQTVYKNSNGRQLSFFTQASISPSQINENCHYLGFGINYSGLFAKRTDDIFGIAVAYAGFNKKNYGKNESIFELTYKAQINENIFIQPDIQYVINPSGTSEKLENAFVAKLRFGLNF